MNDTSHRLLAIDAMRGLTIAIMIMVNCALWGTPVFEPLRHAAWNGLELADLVFPWFVMIMGISVALSLRRFDFKPCSIAVRKILKRTILIFAVGIALDLTEKWMSGGIESLSLSNLRILGVLPRLALSYGGATLIALYVSERGVKRIVVSTLTIYALLLLLFNGFEPSTDNIVARVDLAVLGENHMYHDWVPERIAFDPEGLLGTLPSIAHTLIGYLIGRMLIAVRNNRERVYNLMIFGSILALLGYALSAGLPINKKVWSPTFVLESCGMGAMLLGLLIWAIDIKGYRGWTPAVTVFGVNPLALYVLSSLLGTAVWLIPIGDVSLPAWMYVEWLEPLFGAESGIPSLTFSLMIVAICWIAGYPLWKRGIYIKL